MNAKASSSSVSLSDDHLTLKTESVSTMYGVYICNYIIYIQVVPGRAGGGSFRRKKELYSKERICL